MINKIKSVYQAGCCYKSSDDSEAFELIHVGFTSVGDNYYRHTSSEVLNNLKGSLIYMTDMMGALGR